MAGQARREHRGRARSPHAGSSSRVRAAGSEAGSGSVTATTTAPPNRPSTAALTTRTTYRNLLLRGLAPDEAANLTAYLAGIAIGDAHWTLRQVNQLLFLREMHRSGQLHEPPETRPN